MRSEMQETRMLAPPKKKKEREKKKNITIRSPCITFGLARYNIVNAVHMKAPVTIRT